MASWKEPSTKAEWWVSWFFLATERSRRQRRGQHSYVPQRDTFFLLDCIIDSECSESRHPSGTSVSGGWNVGNEVCANEDVNEDEDVSAFCMRANDANVPAFCMRT